MSKSTPIYYSIQIRVFKKKLFGFDELSGLGEAVEQTIFKTYNKDEAYQYFEELKSKNHKIQQRIRLYNELKPFFQARLLKHKTKEMELISWTWMRKRYIDISYRCKIVVDGKEAWTKKIYHVPPILINHYDCPSRLSSREAKAYACTVLRTLLPHNSFKLEKIKSSEKIDLL